MDSRSDEILEEVANRFVNDFIFLCNKKVLGLISIALVLIGSSGWINRGGRAGIFFPAITFGIVFILHLRKSIHIYRYRKILTQEPIYVIKAEGEEYQGRDNHTYVFAIDEQGNRWERLRCTNTLSAFALDNKKVNGYVLMMEHIRDELFVDEELMRKIQEITTNVLPMPIEEIPELSKEARARLTKLYIIFWSLIALALVIAGYLKYFKKA